MRQSNHRPADIFNSSKVLNTPALQVLGSVRLSGQPENYGQHYEKLSFRLFMLYDWAQASDGREATCAMIAEFLGPDGLTECSTMTTTEIVETAILGSSAGAALLSDLRERWQHPADNAGTATVEITTDEYNAVTLRSWLETLVAEYLDI